MSNKQLLIVGNPNSGKTTLFNRLTGSKQAIGNWAGVTVDKKTGSMNLNNNQIILTDLPGVYSLDNTDSGNSIDESIAINALFSLSTDLIINVVDASVLERSLYFTLQLRELGRPMLVVLNKMDVAKLQGYQIDIIKLEKMLGCKVLDVSATSSISVDAFKDKLANYLDNIKSQSPLMLDYGPEIEPVISNLCSMFKNNNIEYQRANAIRYLSDDVNFKKQDNWQNLALMTEKIQSVKNEIDFDLAIANVRYSHVATLCRESKHVVLPLKTRITDAIDNIVLNQYLGIPIFLGIMYLMFLFSINIGSAFIDFFDIASGALFVDGIHYLFDNHLPVWLMTILADGVGGGIQTVATFIPVIACLYLFLSLLENSGYMARAAFVLDKAMQKIGLPGKAFVPLILGFGCNVPAIMATRTLDQERERRLAAAMAPFMSCGARLPVYALFAAAFFPENGQNVVFLLYLLGIAVAIFTGMILRKTLYPGTSHSMIMEMPRYEWPQLRDVVIKMWHKLKRFIFGAGKTIIVMVTILNFLNTIGTNGQFVQQNTEQTVLSKMAQVITPVFAPIGVQQDNWQATVGIITGIFAKEALVGTLNSLYASSDPEQQNDYDLTVSLVQALQTIPENLLGIQLVDPLGLNVGDLKDNQQVADDQGVDMSIFNQLTVHFTVASAFAYLVFVLLYTPCVAAIGAYVREFGRGYALFIASWTMLMGIVVATLCYQSMMLSQTPLLSIQWIIFSLLLLGSAVFALHLYAKKDHGTMAVVQ